MHGKHDKCQIAWQDEYRPRLYGCDGWLCNGLCGQLRIAYWLLLFRLEHLCQAVCPYAAQEAGNASCYSHKGGAVPYKWCSQKRLCHHQLSCLVRQGPNNGDHLDAHGLQP